MAAPTPFTLPSNSSILNKVLTYLQLERIPQNQYLSLLFNTDQEIVFTELMEVTRAEQAKGWWFNTLENYEIPAGDYYTHTVDHPVLSNSLDLLSVRNKPRNKCDVQDYTRWTTHGQASEIITADHNNAEYDGIVDIIYGVLLDDCPQSFVEYVVCLTASNLAPIFDITLNPDLLARAEFRVLKDQAQNTVKANVFRRP